MSRAVLVRLHVLLAAFMLPAFLMFLVTGALYTWGIKGEYEVQKIELNLDAVLPSDQAGLAAIVARELQARDLALPSGNQSLKEVAGAYQLEWTGANRDVLLAPAADPLKATLTVKDTTWYRQLVQLHKAKGGVAFKVYAALMAVSLLMLMLSGVLMALQLPKLRMLTLGTIGAGVLTFVLMLLFS